MSSQNHLPAPDGIVLRAVESDDFAAIQAIYAQPLACLNTMQMPFPSKRLWQQRLAEDSASRYSLVACTTNMQAAVLVNCSCARRWRLPTTG